VFKQKPAIEDRRLGQFLTGDSVKNSPALTLLFICCSGITTSASWLCYYSAIQNGIVSVVVPIDKLSILVTIVFSYVAFKEKPKKEIRDRPCFVGGRNACHGDIGINMNLMNDVIDKENEY